MAAHRSRSLAVVCLLARANGFEVVDVISTRPVKLPPLNSGAMISLREEFALKESGGATEFGAVIWPCAEYLCRWLSAEPTIVGARILELGSGTGACGIYAAALGASMVTLTDGGGPDMLELLQSNADLNRDLLGSSSLNIERLAWGDLGDGCMLAADQFDYVIAADVMYGMEATTLGAREDAIQRVEALAATFEALLLCSPDSSADSPPRIIVAHCCRSDDLRGSESSWDRRDEVLEYFIGAAARRGMDVAHLDTERPRIVLQESHREQTVNHWSADLLLFEVKPSN